MIDYAITSLMKSPFTEIDWQPNGKAKVYSIISGNMFEVGPMIVDILEYVKKPRLFTEIEKHFDLQDALLEKTIAFLLSKGLVLDTEMQEEATITVTPVANRLFNTGNLLLDQNHSSNSQISFVGVPFGKGNNESTGSRNFPYKLREMVKHYKINLNKSAKAEDFKFLDGETDFTNLANLFQQELIKDYGNIFINTSEEGNFVYDKIFTIANELFSKKVVPFFLGGDHSISYPLIKAALNNYSDLHVIHFDAHTDTYGSRYDYLTHRNKTHHHGNFVSKCLEDSRFNQIYQFGIRGISNMGQRPEARQKIYWFSDIKRAMDAGKTFDLPTDVPYYVTFDIDVLDPSVAPGTATPVPGGFNFEEIKQLFSVVLQNKNIIGLDLVESNPDYDKENLTMQTAIQTILYLLNLINIKN
ncbi:arginase family protein [Chondrinema litorale]|uniref:arginase family protein n=1 Tax=Chondrinema litorale TaxID=2994555 RepID=UPI002542A67A|nr:arginase family protein [Chondrinema litorale]UZR96692.1 arginase family protein [Chondrinema litorale]